MALLKKQKMADAVVEEIKRMIESGELSEGEKAIWLRNPPTSASISRTILIFTHWWSSLQTIGSSYSRSIT